MPTSAKTSAAPAQSKHTEVPPAIFEWYQNRVQEGLQLVYREDQAQRQKIVEIMEELNDSNLFWKLMACYGDAADATPKNGPEQFHVLLPLLARIYIAGHSQRGIGAGAMKEITLTGRRFGEWTVTERSTKISNSGAYWECVCSCGRRRAVISNALLKGRSLSCGHMRSNSRQMLGGVATPEYAAWGAMKSRCKQEYLHRASYFDKGIRVCAEWINNFEAFLAEVGPRPSVNHSLDRIDNDKGYQPGNVRWATKSTQANNRSVTRRFTVNGECLTLPEWAIRLGRTRAHLANLLREGRTPEEVLAPRS